MFGYSNRKSNCDTILLIFLIVNKNSEITNRSINLSLGMPVLPIKPSDGSVGSFGDEKMETAHWTDRVLAKVNYQLSEITFQATSGMFCWSQEWWSSELRTAGGLSVYLPLSMQELCLQDVGLGPRLWSRAKAKVWRTLSFLREGISAFYVSFSMSWLCALARLDFLESTCEYYVHHLCGLVDWCVFV